MKINDMNIFQKIASLNHREIIYFAKRQEDGISYGQVMAFFNPILKALRIDYVISSSQIQNYNVVKSEFDKSDCHNLSSTKIEITFTNLDMLDDVVKVRSLGFSSYNDTGHAANVAQKIAIKSGLLKFFHVYVNRSYDGQNYSTQNISIDAKDKIDKVAAQEESVIGRLSLVDKEYLKQQLIDLTIKRTMTKHISYCVEQAKIEASGGKSGMVHAKEYCQKFSSVQMDLSGKICATLANITKEECSFDDPNITEEEKLRRMGRARCQVILTKLQKEVTGCWKDIKTFGEKYFSWDTSDSEKEDVLEDFLKEKDKYFPDQKSGELFTDDAQILKNELAEKIESDKEKEIESSLNSYGFGTSSDDVNLICVPEMVKLGLWLYLEDVDFVLENSSLGGCSKISAVGKFILVKVEDDHQAALHYMSASYDNKDDPSRSAASRGVDLHRHFRRFSVSSSIDFEHINQASGITTYLYKNALLELFKLSTDVGQSSYSVKISGENDDNN